jgi:hypothetical protein
MMHTKALLEFCQVIGIEAATVKAAEALQGYHLSVDVPAGRLKRISVADLDTLMGEFSNALNLSIGIPDGPPLLKIEHGAAVIDMDQALEHIAQRSNTFELKLDLRLDKSALLGRYGIASDHCHGIFYLFEDNLIKFLASSLARLDETLFVDRYQGTVILVSDANVHYTGPFLSIVGLSDLLQASERPLPAAQNLQQRVDRYHSTAFDSLSWVGFRLKHLTPLHLLCKPVANDADAFTSTLTNHLLHLCILYTANRSSYDGHYFQAYYASSERTTTLALESGAIPADGQSLLTRLALWPYSGKEADRLTIFQNVVARELESDDPRENYSTFASRLKHLLDEARWHHRVFLDGRINKHFEQVQAATGYVSGVTKEVSQSLDSITKGLADTLLATVGVIVITLLASLVKNEAQGAIFRIGMRAYAIYLLLFQGFYRMGSVWQSYWLSKKETDERLAIYTGTLGKKKVDPLASPLYKRRQQFLTWFWLTAGIYLMVVVLIWILGGSLPAYLTQLGVPSPTPTVIPTLTP